MDECAQPQSCRVVDFPSCWADLQVNSFHGAFRANTLSEFSSQHQCHIFLLALFFVNFGKFLPRNAQSAILCRFTGNCTGQKSVILVTPPPPPCLTGGGLASHLSFSYPDPPSPVSSVAHFLCAGLRSAARFLDPGQVQEAVEVVHLRFFQLCVEQCGVSLVVMSATCDE